MENRKPESGSAAVERRPRRLRWLLLAAAVLVILLLILMATARLSAPGGADPWRAGGEQTFGQTTPPAQDAAADPAPEQGSEQAPQAALIVDDRSGAVSENPLARLQATRQAAQEDPAPSTAADAPATSAAGASRSASRPAAPARARAAARPATQEERGGLLSTLLGIIKQDEPAAPAGPNSMDALVAHILTENDRTYSQTSAALASLGQAQPAQAEAPAPAPAATRAQRELQSCPPANTLQGINCRDRVCARYAGRDPACPAR